MRAIAIGSAVIEHARRLGSTCALSLPGPMTLGTGVPLTERHDKVRTVADQCSVGSVHGLMVAEA
jgi:hypothetical protein